MKRRDFIKIGSMLAASSGYLFGNTPKGKFKNSKNELFKSVNLIYDGIHFSPVEYTHLLMKMADEGKIKADNYSNGGIVEELENTFAQLLNMESAVFMPTGTLANHIAIRKLAGKKSRAVVPAESHIYNDSGDCVQNLSHINLIPLGKNKECFSLEDLEIAVKKTKSGRVKTGIGVMIIETPVRRQLDRIVPLEEVIKLSDFARNQEMKIHIDGARLFVQAAHEDKPLSNYCQLADTVYTSLYKCFNAASGAILAGKKEFTADLFHTRRMFGGGMPNVWPFAAIALQFADSFIEDYKKASLNADIIFKSLEKTGSFKIEKFINGSHILKLHIKDCNLSKFKTELGKRNVFLYSPGSDGFLLKINPSLNRIKPDFLANIFKETLVNCRIR